MSCVIVSLCVLFTYTPVKQTGNEVHDISTVILRGDMAFSLFLSQALESTRQLSAAAAAVPLESLAQAKSSGMTS